MERWPKGRVKTRRTCGDVGRVAIGFSDSIENRFELSSRAKRSKRVVEKFGMPHWVHSQVALLLFRVS